MRVFKTCSLKPPSLKNISRLYTRINCYFTTKVYFLFTQCVFLSACCLYTYTFLFLRFVSSAAINHPYAASEIIFVLYTKYNNNRSHHGLNAVRVKNKLPIQFSYLYKIYYTIFMINPR